MLLTSSFILILSFSVFGYIMINTYRDDHIEETRTRLFQVGNIIGDTYKRNADDRLYLQNMVRNYGDQSNARILIVNGEREVLFDNYNSLLEETVNNQEVRHSLNGQASANIYPFSDNEVMQLSIPITYTIGYDTDIIGVVLISSSLAELNSSLDELRTAIIRIASLLIIGALILTAFSSATITRSLRKLTIGVEKIFSGHLGYQVQSNEKGEIGNLVNTFNHMSQRLYHIETNRKSYINSISHELRTPITSINALIDSLLLGENTIETYDEFLKDIQNETLRMKDLVDYLMGSIKLEEITLDLKEENLSKIVQESISLITPYAEKHNVTIKMDIQENINIKCDKNRVKEVMLNLLENGIKYRDDNKKDSYIQVTLSQHHPIFELKVEDNGIGIATDHGKKIFDRGFRVIGEDTLTEQKIEGYGIGLALVKNIIEKHHWIIGFSSEVGLGTVFNIKNDIY